ncbi:hypothetical protein [Desertivirga xinjiangensis]|uniref:hypothetical protein n=1 Tax=Desertivirga xinjiangensis TaxID=539206 RepID=UPI00210BF9BE|nr:hypothetical protein [Pedobacter xinjiangensis]
MKNQKIILALLAGAATGAIAAILLTSDDGKTTRSRIGEWAGEKLRGANKGAGVEEETEETTLGI